MPRKCKQRSNNSSNSMQSTHLPKFDEIRACSARHQAHSIPFHQHHHSNLLSTMLSLCHNRRSLYPPSPLINHSVGHHQRPHHDLLPIPNCHDSRQTRCIFNSLHPTIRRVRTHCNRPKPTRNHRRRRHQYTSITGFHQPKASQSYHKHLLARRAAAILNPAPPIPHSQRAASITAIARASVKHKVAIKRSRHLAAQCPRTRVHRFPQALDPIGEELEVATSGVEAI
jgi:hypothetical protein